MDSSLDRRLPEDSIGGADERSSRSEHRLGDFTIRPADVKLAGLALVVGALSAGVALALLRLIGLATHIAYHGSFSTAFESPPLRGLRWWTVFIPVAGGLLVGLMARFGSERIRGHGIPEAMETILIGGSKARPRLALLKPVSSAISIGTGGPFGAEGPIILTGGAVGSVFAQFLHLSAIERRTLLVAGSCGGMAAVFGTPVAAVLFGVELLVFEWRPRSLVPIASSVAVAATLRGVFVDHGLVAPAPLFPLHAAGFGTATAVLEALAVGVVAAAVAWLLTVAVYGAEDAFKRLPFHWSWWPMIGGLVVGVGGLVDPRALGVGYGTISAELSGRLAIGALALLLVVKLVIWATALGSGTSGGILAPLLMIGAAAGGLVGHALGAPVGTCAALGMAATLSGTTRSPFTSIVFGVELTHAQGLLLELLVACVAAHFVSAIVLRRSIVTEKVARRGYHVMREYGVDPLEAMFVREVMQDDLIVVAATDKVGAVRHLLERDPRGRRQRTFPVLDADGGLRGVVRWSDLADADPGAPVGLLAVAEPALAYDDEVLRTVATRMAATGVGAMPVIVREGPVRIVGVVTESDLLAGRRRQLVEERERERPFRLPLRLARPPARSV